jgi:predicted esterase
VRRAAVVVVVGTALLIAAPGAPPADAGPPGARYVDPVFAVQETPDLQYGANVRIDGVAGTQDLLLDLYEPAGDTSSLRPVVVLAHGGGFCGGSRTSGRMVQHARYLAQRGWVAASTGYRVDPRQCDSLAALIAAAEDGRAAVRWFRAHAAELRIDPSRISFLGYSAGAWTAIGLAFSDSSDGSSGNPGHSSRISAAISQAGAHFGRPASVDAPIQMVHGDLDTRVPFQWGVDTCEHLQSVGSVCELLIHDGADHNLPVAPMLVDAASFLHRCVAEHGDFPDVPLGPGDLEPAVGWMSEWGITSGFPDGRFRPSQAVTRHQLATFLWRLAGQPVPTAEAEFTDVPTTAPYAEAVAWMAETGLSTGYGDGTFRPDRVLTRQQLAMFLWRAVGEPDAPVSTFSDVPLTAAYADAVGWLASTGVTTGFSDGTFRPDRTVNRSQAAQMLWRLTRAPVGWEGPLDRPASSCSSTTQTR